ncbi:hypothetical protein [Henriciella aquimarina]|uniref:hypothetical protein n=1 Tax=Henriciella aquimarina TaxID=545261 RepID=UPI000A06F130|nr:hypothetical protein [Henriciella aquimarina]
MMPSATFETAADDLYQILAAEKELLLSGRAADTAGLAEEKLKAMESFEAIVNTLDDRAVSDSHRGQIMRIAKLAQENTIHFTAVRNGLRNAVTRLETMSDESYVGAYRLDGAKTPFTKATGGYEKKV